MKRAILLVALMLLPGLEARAQGSAETFCKSASCASELSPWLKQLEACKGSGAKIISLEQQIRKLEGDRDEGKTALSLCTIATETAEKLAKDATAQIEAAKKEASEQTEALKKEASEHAEALKKAVEPLKEEIETLKKKLAEAEKVPGAGLAEQLTEAVRRANLWKEEADRLKAEGETLQKEATDAKAEVEGAKKEAADAKAERDAAKAELEMARTETSSLKTKIAERGLFTVDPGTGKDPRPPEVGIGGGTAASGDVVRLQKELEDTRRELVATDSAIKLVLNDLQDRLGRAFECASFSVETRGSTRVLKGTVAESRHRDDAWRMVVDAGLSKLVPSYDIEVMPAGAQVCFVRTRAEGYMMARERGKPGQPYPTFLRRLLDASIIAMLPRAGADNDCDKLGDVIKSLEPIPNRPIGADAVFVLGDDGKVAQCYDSGAGWRLRPVSTSDGKSPAWLLVPQGRSESGLGRP